MSLRFRLIALVMAALSASLGLGSVVILINTSRAVRTEMHAALVVGRQTIDTGLDDIAKMADPQRGLDALIGSFRGTRHLRVQLTGGVSDLQVDPARERLAFGNVPKWFVRFIAVAPESDKVPVAIGGKSLGTIVITTDPRNEIREAWSELSSSLFVLALFSGATIPLIYLSIGRTLRPLNQLIAAMEQVGRGDYAIRVDGRLTPELARVRDAFNLMAGRLAATDARNRRLNEQILTLQEEERAEFARDLHDEVGPLLFALNVDVGTMRRALEEDRSQKMANVVQSIGDAARDLQSHIRAMLGRLRPIRIAEFGLADALEGLVAFWRRRGPEINYRISVAPDCQTFGEPIDTAVYRIVQECLSNAVRHGNPTHVTVSVERAAERGEVIVRVADDGTGASAAPTMGYGLTGMRERAEALGGRLRLDHQAAGFAVTAALPCTPSSTPVLQGSAA